MSAGIIRGAVESIITNRVVRPDSVATFVVLLAEVD